MKLVLNNRNGNNTRVGAATAERAQKIAERLNYRPNPAARQLAGGRPRLIGGILMKKILASVMMRVAMGWVLSGGAVSARAYDAYEYFFWDDLRDWNTPQLIDDTACHTALPYNPFMPENATINGSYPPGWVKGASTRDAWVKAYLDYAAAHGMTVILSCAELLKEVKNQPAMYSRADFTQYINTFKDHPALKGWYLADEPTDNSLLEACKTGYDIIKKTCGSAKPIYLAFEYQALALETPVNYKGTYDIMMFDHYVCVTGEPEFNRFEKHSGHNWPGWKEYCTTAMAQASALGKPFINILQAQGRDEDSSNYRLPTYNEERFMTFWSVLKGSAGVSFWAMDQLINETKAYPGDLYPSNGATWRTEVAKPICQELEQLKYALGAGPVPNGVTGRDTNILSKVYRDPSTSKYYLLTVNDSASASSAVTLSIAVPGSWSHLAECGAGRIPVVGKAVSLGNYAKYQVRNFELVPAAYPVTFDAQGGSAPNPASASVTYGSAYGTLATTARTGHTFGGWRTGPGGAGTEVTAATTVTGTAAPTLYAMWTGECR